MLLRRSSKQRKSFVTALVIGLALVLVTVLSPASAADTTETFNYTIYATGSETREYSPIIGLFNWALEAQYRDLIYKNVIQGGPVVVSASGNGVTVVQIIEGKPGTQVVSYSARDLVVNICGGGDGGTYLDRANNRLVAIVYAGDCGPKANAFYSVEYTLTSGEGEPEVNWTESQWVYGSGKYSISASDGEILLANKVEVPPPKNVVKGVLETNFALSFTHSDVYGRFDPVSRAVYAQTDPQLVVTEWDGLEEGTATTAAQDGDKFILTSSLVAPNNDTVWTVYDDNDSVDTWMVGADLYAKVNTWPFTGFFPPVDNPPTINSVKSGSAVPVKFSLGGNYGLNILATGYPKSVKIACDTSLPIDDVEETVTAGNSSLQYNPANGQYTYVWKTDKAWANTCRQFQLQLADGTLHLANFKFK